MLLLHRIRCPSLGEEEKKHAKERRRIAKELDILAGRICAGVSKIYSSYYLSFKQLLSFSVLLVL